MFSLLGKYKLKPFMEAGLSSLAEKLGTHPLNDLQLLERGSPWGKVDPLLIELVRDRVKFRIFCRQKGLFVPNWVETKSFQSASNWVIGRKSFPLVLKTQKNASDGFGIFRLEGFKDLLRFYDRAEKLGLGSILIEDWIETKLRIEVTFGSKGIYLISQVGLEPSLFVRTAWRQFPMLLSKPQKQDVKEILRMFAPFLKSDQVVCRSTFAIDEDGIRLLSLNGGMNRLEYVPEWVSITARQSVFEILAEGDLKKKLKCEEPLFARILNFKRAAKSGNWPEILTAGTVGQLPIRKYSAIGNYAAILLAGKDQLKLSQDSQTISGLMNSL